ncbi:MAG: diguanylate cyclase, partial [Burkholderiaceae bacterium]|nr:diguanylate cyclase [Burkholderiaceae bacterium]
MLVTAANERTEGAKIEHELLIGERIYRRLLEDARAQLAQAATRAAADGRLRDALAAQDIAAAESALRAHGAGIDAELMLAVDPRGRVLADGASTPQRGRALALATALDTARREGLGAAVLALEGQAYQVVAAPLAGDPTLAAIVLGTRFDDALAGDLRRLTDLAVSFLLVGADGMPRPIASSLPAPQRQEIGVALGSAGTRTERLAVKLAGLRYEARLIASEVGAGERLLTVLARARDSGRLVTPLTVSLLLLALFSLPLAVWLSYLVARSITQPLSQLASAAQRMRAGDYSAPIRVNREDELGLLAGSLNHLREGIARREREILRLAYDDPLTGLPNRSLLMDRLQQGLRAAARRQEPLAVMVLDLDRFKEINDMLGHVAGDAVLKQVAARLQAV